MKKMFVIQKKNIVVGLLVLLLIVTGYLNFIFNQNATPAVNPKDPVSSSDKNDKNADETAPGGMIPGSDTGFPVGRLRSAMLMILKNRETRIRSRNQAKLQYLLYQPFSETIVLKESKSAVRK